MEEEVVDEVPKKTTFKYRTISIFVTNQYLFPYYPPPQVSSIYK